MSICVNNIAIFPKMFYAEKENRKKKGSEKMQNSPSALGFNASCIAFEPEFLVFSRPKDEKIDRIHGKARHSLVYLFRGKMQLRIPSSKKSNFITLSQGDLFYTPPALLYDTRYLEETSLLSLSFDLSAGKTLFTRRMLTVLPASSLAGSEVKKQLYSLEEGENLPAQVQRKMWWIHEFFFHLGELDSQSARKEKFKKLDAVLETLQKDFALDRPLSYYAALSGLSESGFRKLFGEFCGTSFVKFRNNLRLHHARALLQTGEYSAKEAALASGITNMGYFSRSYKASFGSTPGAEKKQAL